MIFRDDFEYGVFWRMEYFGVWSILVYGIEHEREERYLKSRITRYSRPAKGFITLQNIGHFYMIFMASASCLFG